MEEYVRQYNLPSKLAPIFTQGYKPAAIAPKRKATADADNDKPSKAMKISSPEEETVQHQHSSVEVNSLLPESNYMVNGNGTKENNIGVATDQNNGMKHEADDDDDIEFIGSVSSNSTTPHKSELADAPNLYQFHIPHDTQLIHIPGSSYPNAMISHFAAAHAVRAAATSLHPLGSQTLPQAILASAAARIAQQRHLASLQAFAEQNILPAQQNAPLYSPLSFNTSANNCYSSCSSLKNSPNCSLVAGKNLVLGPDGQIYKKRGRPVLSESEKARKREFQKQMAVVFLNLGVTSSPNRPLSPICSDSPHREQYFSSPTKSLGSPTKTPQKKIHTAESVMKLPMVRRLLFEHKNRKTNKGFARKVVYTMDHAVTKLSITQINLITDESLKESLLSRHERMLEKRLLQGMTPADRVAYMKEKAKETATKKRHEKQALNRKLEDQNLEDLLPLPEPSPIITIEGVSNTAFCDIAMLTEFLECFAEVFNLQSLKDSHFTTSEILHAVSRGQSGYSYISSLLCTMLPTVLYDSAMTHYKELGIPLREMPISYQTAPELARLCLKHQKQDLIVQEYSEDGEDLVIGEEEDELSEDLLQKLTNVELWELRADELVAFLTALTHRCMASDTLAAHVDKMEDMATKIYKERAHLKKQRLKDDSEMKKKKREERNAKKKIKKPPGRPKGYSPRLGMTIADFYECKQQGQEISPRKELLQNRQKRKSTLEKMEEEKREQERKEVEKIKLDRDDRFRQCQEILQKRRQTLRVTPLGKDRHHSRYWLFHTTTPGLYVEKGSMHDHMDYVVTINDDDFPSKKEIKKPLNDLSSELDEFRTPTKGRPKSISFLDMDADNQTLPQPGNNAWFVYKTQEEVDMLIEALSDRGIREHYLKQNLINARTRISLNIAAGIAQEEKFNKAKNGCESATTQNGPEAIKEETVKEEITDYTPEKSEMESPGKSEVIVKIEEGEAFDCCKHMLISLKDDIIQIEKELIEGWLGGVDDFEEWAKCIEEVRRINAALYFRQFVNLISLFLIILKFLNTLSKEPLTRLNICMFCLV